MRRLFLRPLAASLLSVALPAAGLAGCADGETADVVVPRDSGRADTTASDDTSAGDTTAGDDTGTGDTGAAKDSGTPDTGSLDTGTPDTGTLDTGSLDTGSLDTGSLDTGSLDTGSLDTGTLDTGPLDTGPLDTGVTDTGTDTGVVADRTTGKTCTSDFDCDVTGLGLGVCTNGIYIVGPLNPTAVCVQIDFSGFDACTPTDTTTIRYCDGDTGICLKSGTSAATCEPRCQLKGDGTWVETCAGKNACYPEALTTASDGKTLVVGSCQGGCVTSADCPIGSVCDAGQNLCVNKTCTTDTACKTAWGTGAPAAWKCDTAVGYCKFIYPKALGAACTTATDCLCLKGTTATAGYCTEICKTGGGECPTGYSCDALLTATSSTGGALYTMTSLPAGLSGYCAKNCTSDAGCPTGTKCVLSGGMGAQKTCQP